MSPQPTQQEIAVFYLSEMDKLSERKWWQTLSKKRAKEIFSELVESPNVEDGVKKRLKAVLVKL